jgi:hypothetical protein
MKWFWLPTITPSTTGDDPKKGLASELAREAVQCPRALRVLPSLSDLLSEIRKPIEISDELLESAIKKALGNQINDLLERTAFAPLSARFNKTFFATEAPNVLYLEFGEDLDCQDVSNEGRTDAVLRLQGDGRYDLATQSFSDLRPHELSVSYLSASGEREQKRNVYLYAEGIVIGHQSVSNVIREKLE